MNKSELIGKVSEKTGLTRKAAAAALGATLEIIQSSLKNKENVVITGFGAFGVKERKARVGRNPRTKEEFPIPASNLPYFKPGKLLKESIK